MPTSPLITLKNVNYDIENKTILRDISLQIEQQELLTIVGPNGAGKSTLIRMILGHIQPSSGHIARQKPIRMAYVPQHFNLPVDLPITVHRFLKGLDYQADNSPTKKLNISHLLDSPLQNLSGGETQRLLLSRAMLNSPDIIFLDEPAAGIDPAALGHYYQSIRDYQIQRRCAIVMISHDIHLVMAASDSVLCLNKHICCVGKPEDIAEHPDFIALLGDNNADTIGVYTHQHTHIHL